MFRIRQPWLECSVTAHIVENAIDPKPCLGRGATEARCADTQLSSLFTKGYICVIQLALDLYSTPHRILDRAITAISSSRISLFLRCYGTGSRECN